jgi:HD-GYP domain-containing protein (c-di-GMP phosphodiesterase class II)
MHLYRAADAFEQYDRLSALVPNFSLPELQQHSLTVSSYAVRIARAHELSATLSNTAGMAGVLHDIGMLVLRRISLVNTP